MLDLVTCNILNTELLATTVDDTVVVLCGEKEIANKEFTNKAKGQYICNVSVEDVLNAKDDDEYLKALDNSLFNLPNSGQLVVEMRTQGYPLSKKISVFELIKKSLTESERKGLKQFFVCEDRHLADCIELSVKEKYPELIITGACVYSDLEDDGEEKDAAIKAMNEADIIWVGIGGKKGAIWLYENANKFNAIAVDVNYALSSFIKGQVWNDTRRFDLGYVGMNIRYLLLTGKKLFWNTVSWIPTLITIIIIFMLTFQTGDVSKANSGEIAKQVSYNRFFGMDLSFFASSFEFLEELNKFIRLLAHISEYAFLSLSIGFAMTVNGIRSKLRFIYMCILGVFVAVIDEFTQIFVVDRYGDLFDLACDFLGIIFMAMLVYILGQLFSKIMSKRKNAKESNKNLTLEKTNSTVSRRRKFLNVYIDDISFDDAIDRIIDMAKTASKQYVVTPNVDHIIKIEKDMLFRKIYERADLIVTDGTPLLWVAESMGYPIKEKIAGSDMFPRICERAAKEGLTMFFLGAEEGVAVKAKENLTNKYPGLNVLDCYSPPLGFEKNKKELEKIFEIVNKANADILVLSLGSPKQEKFMYNNMDRLNFKVALPFGAAMDFEAGHVKRAPLWMRKNGLEWFYRFLLEPGRLFRRYFIDDIKIFWIAWKYRNEIIRIK